MKVASTPAVYRFCYVGAGLAPPAGAASSVVKKATMYCGFALLLAVGGAVAQETPVTLHVVIDNNVRYNEDLTDPARVARSPVPVTANFTLNFGRNVVIGDVVEVNGSPANGVSVSLENGIFLNPNPMPGQAISDVTQGQFGFYEIDFLKPNGDRYGTIFAAGPVGGAGAAIIGGTGAYLGAKGTLNAEAPTGQRPVRLTSQAEDPGMRRTNGGGRNGWLIRLYPMFRPAVLITPGGPAIAHSTDFALISTSRPAAAGEILSAFVIGLGPTVPAVAPDSPFPASPLAVVSSPVTMTVNGKAAEVLAAVGFPGAVGGYQINFRVPSDALIATKVATIQVSAAWIPGAPVNVPTQ
jgi:uncharacterized protein (TIGR03437 family)